MFLANVYCTMLYEEIGVNIFQKMSSDESVDQEVRQLCFCILDTVNNFRNFEITLNRL